MKTTQTTTTLLNDESHTDLSEQELNQLFILIKNSNDTSDKKCRAEKIAQLKKQISDRTYPISSDNAETRYKAAHSILNKIVALEEV